MKENRKLDNQEIENVSGGGVGYNKYPREVYYAAGIITEFFYPFMKDLFHLRLTESTYSHGFYQDVANDYTDFYLSHSREEYLAYIQKTFPDVRQLYPGYDITR